MPDPAALFAAFETTWPPLTREALGPLTYRDGAGGGSRVSAATLDGTFSPAALEAVETRFVADGRDALFQIRDSEEAFDAELERRGYRMFDPVACLIAPLDAFPASDPKTGYACWPPVAIQQEIWAEGGIGPARLAIMERVPSPKCTLLGRLGDTPAGTGFVAIHQGIAALHALETSAAHRRQGLARAMMALAADWARAQGANSLALQVTRANTGALALYSSLGMQQAGQYHYRTKPLSEFQ
ncbi:MAG: GNAT family N-acetyltransferase [Rhodobacteraceae bacterium]|nr:MAG: GNAT family N-acetyltransferase [Paracoccaceae bacterium]